MSHAELVKDLFGAAAVAGVLAYTDDRRVISVTLFIVGVVLAIAALLLNEGII